MGLTYSDIECQEWYQAMISPVRGALYTADKPAAQAALEQGWQELQQLSLDTEASEMTELMLHWYEFVIAIQGKPAAGRIEAFDVSERILTAPAATMGGEHQRRRLLAILRCIGNLYMERVVTRVELVDLIEDLPRVDADEFLWHHIGSWAFARRDLMMLQRAYTVMLTSPSSLLGQAKWQRVNMMLQLLSGKATRRDVEETIRHMEVLPQVAEFRQTIWPVCIEQGLVDDDLTQMLEQAHERLSVAPPMPGRERRTKRIRG